MRSYCLYCKSGSEQTVADRLNALGSDLVAIAPRRIVQEKRKNQWERRDLALLPGYVFLFCEDEATLPFRLKVTDMYRLLQYETGLKELLHEDREYALWIYRNHGNIAPSRILADGDTIKVVEGPLMESSGKIVRIDRHKRRALVEFDFDGQKRTISLAAECISPLETQT